MKKVTLSTLILFSALTAISQTALAKATKTFSLQVTEKGFEPSQIKVKPGTKVVLKITRKTDTTCATEIVLKEKGINKTLPLNKEVTVNIGTLKEGDITFACAMDMITGHIIVN